MAKLLQNTPKNDILILPNVLLLTTIFQYNARILNNNINSFEFDKTQIPYAVGIKNTARIKVCLATTGVCVFVRGFGCALFYFSEVFMNCENRFCVYYYDDQCILEPHTLDHGMLGECTSCVLLDIDEEILDEKRNDYLKKFELEYYYGYKMGLLINRENNKNKEKDEITENHHFTRKDLIRHA